MKKAPSDGRSWIVRINPRSKRHFADVAVAHHHWIGEMLAGMSSEHSHALYDLLAELKDTIARAPDDA